MLAPVESTIEVAAGQKDAFTIFAEGMPDWWPLDKRSMSLMNTGTPAKELRVDARAGGRIVEIAADDSEIHWGTFREYDPFESIRLDFHMGMPAENASLVEVTFTPIDDERTLVRLVQSNWEAFGDMAEMLRSGYGSSWGMLLAAYAALCG